MSDEPATNTYSPMVTAPASSSLVPLPSNMTSRRDLSKIHIILGGDDKGVSIEKVVATAAKQGATIYAIGSNCDDIEKMSNKFGAKVFNAKELYNAVNLIDKEMNIDDVALLSPACASLDQFSSYAHRGDKFKEFIAKII